MRLSEIIDKLDRDYPFEEACSYDNVGLLVGRRDKDVKKVLVALDVTTEVIREAREVGADLILAHHPVIFRETKKVTDETYAGRLVLALAESGIAAAALHTNFDKAAAGNNDRLAASLGAKTYEKIEDGFATAFDLEEETDFASFAASVKEKLGDAVVRTIGSGRVKRVIAACGAGIDEGLIFRAEETGAVIVTADVKHNYASMIRDLGVRLVETTHYASEWGFTKQIGKYLAENFSLEVFVSRHNINPYG